jgi:hypothetical protein
MAILSALGHGQRLDARSVSSAIKADLIETTAGLFGRIDAQPVRSW